MVLSGLTWVPKEIGEDIKDQGEIQVEFQRVDNISLL